MFTKRKLIPPREKEIQFRKAELAYRIKDIRLTSMITVRELAEVTGVSTKTIYRLENAKSVKLESLLRILDVFDCYLDILEKKKDGDSLENLLADR